jgi:hypothetical protein
MTRLASMRRFLALSSALALGLVCAVTVASCGGGGTLAGATSQQLLDALDQIQADVDQGNCTGAGDKATSIASQIETRTDIDAKLKVSLVDGFQRVAELASDPTQCEAPATTSTETQTQETITETTPTETTPTETTPTQTTDTQTTPTTDTGGTGGTGGGNGGTPSP